MVVARIRPLSLAKVMGALVAAPVFYGLLGFLGGLFTAAVYNVAAGAIGGVELEVLER